MKTIPNQHSPVPTEALEYLQNLEKTTFSKAQSAALKFLSYRSRSEAELRRRLESSNYDEVTDRVIAWLKDNRLLDDAAFADAWRHQRELRHPRGERLIRQELSNLGVGREVVEVALDGFDATDNAYRAAQKPAARAKSTGHARFRQRLWGYLGRRGFESEVIRITVQRLWDELSDPLDSHVDAHSHEDQTYDFETEVRDLPTDQKGQSH